MNDYDENELAHFAEQAKLDERSDETLAANALDLIEDQWGEPR